MNSILNQTVHGLTLKNIFSKSPLISLPYSSNAKTFSFINSDISKSFNSAIRGIAPEYTSLSSIKFSNFLNTGVHLADSESTSKQIFKIRPKINSSICTLTDCQFIQCQAPTPTFDGCEGGGLLARGVILTLSKCLFRQNYAHITAGGLRVTSSALTDISDTTFYENKASSFAAAASFWNVFSLSLSNCNFILNSCDEEVSGIALSDCPSVSLSNIQFMNNSAKKFATLFIESSMVDADKLVFSGNKLDKESSLYTQDKADVSIKNSNFIELTEDSISISAQDDDQINLESCNFNLDEEHSLNLKGAKITKSNLQFSIENSFSFTVLQPLDATKVVPQQIDDGQVMPIVTRKVSTPRATPSPTPKIRVNKSMIMLIAYGFVIFMLIIGIKIYFSTGSPSNVTIRGPEDTSLFGDDFNFAQDAFLPVEETDDFVAGGDLGDAVENPNL